MVTLNIHVDEYTNRVLGVIKEAFGLKDKSEALQKFVQMYGEDFLQRQVSQEVLKEVISLSNAHMKKYGFRKMANKELDKLCGIK
ncbi:MAG: hypothetical protein ABIH83_03545 [Candidatus Micrarchaeota archaeon]